MSHGGLGIEHLVDVEPIGPSGGNDLFTATDLKLDRTVAVRVLPTIVSEGERGRFVDRARALAGLSSHPNIVTVYDAGITPDGGPYLITELVAGPSLADRLESGGSMPWNEAIELTLQLAAGLEQVHQAGGRHRDLRPENIVLAGSTATLTDVGLLPTPEAEPETPATLAHRAPETLSGDGDERSDLYSLTSILYLLIDGRAPFWRPADTVEAIRARLLAQPAPPLDPELLPPALAVFVAAGLSDDPLDRPQHIGEFSAELRLIVEGRVTGSTPSVLHAVSGAVPVVTPDPTTAGVAAVPLAANAAGLAPAGLAARSTADVGPMARTDEGAGPPSWAFDTAELTTNDGRPLTPASSWAPPSSSETRSSEPLSFAAAGAIGLATPRADQGLVTFDPEPPSMPSIEPEFGAQTADNTTLIPTFQPDLGPPQGPDRPSLLLVAGAMISLALLVLVAVLAVGLRGSDTEGEATAPVLADPNAPTEAGAGASEAGGAPTTLTPLAMLPESTTSTVSDEMVTSTDTTLRRVVVPNLVNLEVSAAGQQLSDAGFDVLVVGRVSPGSILGTVIQQTPAAGSTIELPATVTLFIPRPTTLPSMVGRPADTVCQQLTTIGLRCERILRFSDRVAVGAVIATDPTEGSAFADGQTIRVEVSLGRLSEARIPRVTGLGEDQAKTTLGNAGFIAVTTVSVVSDNVPAGQAIGTEPAAGTSLAVDKPVVIQISSGPARTVTVPDLVGLDRAAAEAALRRAQLTGTFTGRDLPAGDPNIGRVLSVEPGAATQLPTGSTVAVTVGQAAAGSSTTTTAPSDTTSTTADSGG